MLVSRRGLLLGIGAAGIFGPAILKVNHLMPISSIDDWNPYVLALRISSGKQTTSAFNQGTNNVQDAIKPLGWMPQGGYSIKRLYDLDYADPFDLLAYGDKIKIHHVRTPLLG